MIVVKYFKSNLNNFLHNVKFVNNKLNKKIHVKKKGNNTLNSSSIKIFFN